MQEFREGFPSLSGKTFIRTQIYHVAYGPRASEFPSLSGKTFIRTAAREIAKETKRFKVSIPFREDLHSDIDYIEEQEIKEVFVSIPFREDLHSDSKLQAIRLPGRPLSFHPFQGRPSFGPRKDGHPVHGM